MGKDRCMGSERLTGDIRIGGLIAHQELQGRAPAERWSGGVG